MDPSTLSARICQCIDDLSLLLDQIYKFPQKQRENYFDRIQTMKNRLLTLKANIRECNTTITQKQYKQLYLAMNALKNQITQQNTLLPSNKESKENTRFTSMKQMRKTYEDTMRLLVQKDEELKELKGLLFEKQELIRINYQELKAIRRQHEVLRQASQIDKYEHDSFATELERTKSMLMEAEHELRCMNIRGQEKDLAFNQAIQELQRLKEQLVQANDKIIILERSNDACVKKTRLEQQNAKKAQKMTQELNDNYLRKEQDNFKQLRQINDLELQVKILKEKLRQEEGVNKLLREDIQVLEIGIEKNEKDNDSLRVQLEREREKMHNEKQTLRDIIDEGIIRQNELKRLLSEADKKYLLVMNKLTAAEEYKEKLVESQCQREVMLDKITSLQCTIDNCHADNKFILKEKEKLQIKLEHESTSIRELQVQLFRMKQKIKIKDQEMVQLRREIDRYKNKLRQCEKQIFEKEKKEKSIESLIVTQKERLFKMQQKQKVNSKEIQSLKVKLLKAKIQTVREIRQTMN